MSDSSLRLRLILGKFQVIKLDRGALGLRATVSLPGSVTMTIDCPPGADVRLGDWFTYYTECPYAQPEPTPQQ